MHRNKQKFLVIFIILSVIPALFSSCERNSTEKGIISPTPIVYENPDSYEALYSGNLLFGQTLASNGKCLYFISKDGSQLIKANCDGNHPIVLSSKEPCCISYVNKNVFFISGSSGGPIFKVDTDGNGETMITDRTAVQLIAAPMNIFFIDAKDGLLYSIEHDGSNRTLLYPDKVIRIMRFGENLYLIPEDSPDTMLILNKARIASIISEDHLTDLSLPAYDFVRQALYVNVSKDTVYFTDAYYNGIYAMSFGENPRKISELKLDSPFILNNGYIYFIDPKDERRLYRFSVNRPDNIELVANDAVYSFAVMGNSVFYYRDSGSSVYRVSVGGGISEKVS